MPAKSTPFYKWFTTFLEEKGVDMAGIITDKIQVGDVCQAIVDTGDREQAIIKNTIVKIDFVNGNVLNYFAHLAQAL